jgi:peptidoglycan/xylan/chitin deacetylase (PgdA/CDA1 family)
MNRPASWLDVRLGALAVLGLLGLGSFSGIPPEPAPVAGVLARAIMNPDDPHSAPPPLEQAVSATVSPRPSPPPPDTNSQINARVAPYLALASPSGAGIPVNSPVTVVFSQPMERASVALRFAIAPSASGRLAWVDDVTLTFEPDRFEHGTTYLVQVGGRSALGVPVTGGRAWSFTTVAAPPITLTPGPASIRVPILTYHYIRVIPDVRDRLGFALSVTPSDFAAQMDWLAGNGYNPITTDDLYTYLSGARGLPSRPVILTFDDGYADFFTTALPILRAHDFKAVAYIVSGFVGQPGYMTAAQVAEADRQGVEIGSHTVSHANLSRLSAAAVSVEVAASKQALEGLVGHPVVSFCYPSGRFTGYVAAAVEGAGYHDATTTMFGFVHALSDRYVWTRLRISGGEGLADFAAAVSGAS